MFVDEIDLLVRGGRGGNGVVSFHREKYVPHGGPDGGDGGDGGSLFLQADSAKQSFLDLKHQKQFKAADGEHGRGNNCHGRKGTDLIIPVPPGTIVRDEKGSVISDLIIEGQIVRVARGGKGGKGNARFTSSRNRAPRVAERGLPGTERKISLELKLIAQVGLVGFPNAGKSTLLSKISSAQPKIASYPFTTIAPNLGVVEYAEGKRFIVADLPGLTEGAHKGIGLGHRFLKHVERNLLLLFLIDLSPDAEPLSTRAYDLLLEEMINFNPEIQHYPHLVVGNKLDLPGAGEQMKSLQNAVSTGQAEKVFAISALSGEGLDDLLSYLTDRVEALVEENKETSSKIPVYSYNEDNDHHPMQITKKDNLFIVTGTEIEQRAAKTDFESEEGLRRFQKYCRINGVEAELRKMGIKEGDTVCIGEEEFLYYE